MMLDCFGNGAGIALAGRGARDEASARPSPLSSRFARPEPWVSSGAGCAITAPTLDRNQWAY